MELSRTQQQLEKLAIQYDNGELTYTQLRRAEREIEAEAAGKYRLWTIGVAAALQLVGFALFHAFYPRYTPQNQGIS